MKIHFNDADPAGVAFSGRLFSKIHQCYEEFVAALDQDPQAFFLNPTVLFPLRHFEGEFLAPLLPLRTYEVQVGVIKISSTSFQLQYMVLEDGKAKALFRSRHVAVDKKQFTKAELPQCLKSNLEKFVIPQ